MTAQIINHLPDVVLRYSTRTADGHDLAGYVEVSPVDDPKWRYISITAKKLARPIQLTRVTEFEFRYRGFDVDMRKATDRPRQCPAWIAYIYRSDLNYTEPDRMIIPEDFLDA